MKRNHFLILFFMVAALPAGAQLTDIFKLVTEKIIREMDLRVQELQQQTLIQQTLTLQKLNQLSDRELGIIGNITAANTSQFEKYYASLMQVNPGILQSSIVREIRKIEQDINAYLPTFITQIKRNHWLNTEEISKAAVVIKQLQAESEKLSFELKNVLMDKWISATDDERLQLLAALQSRYRQQWGRLQNLQQRVLNWSLIKAANENEKKQIQRLYGL